MSKPLRFQTALYNNLSFFRDIKQKEQIFCLIANPAILEDELESNTDVYVNGRQYILGAKTQQWKINFNIERLFNFGVTFEYKNVSSSLPEEDRCFRSMSPIGGIPKIFHFIWSDEIVPSVFVRNLKRFYVLHQTWKFFFWTLSHGRELIENLEPQLLPTYDKYRENIFKADALRYVLMYHIGGAYFDLDTYPNIPLDTFTWNDCVVGPEPAENAVFIYGIRSVLSNAGFLCKPNHAFLRHVINLLPVYSHVTDVMESTGPVFFSGCLNSYVKSQLVMSQEAITEPKDISVVRHEYFEFFVNRKANSSLRHACSLQRSLIDFFANNCKTKEIDLNQSRCNEIPRNMNPENLMVFEACVEWALHERGNSDTDSLRYVDHVHYGTYVRPESLRFQTENNVTNIIPNVIVNSSLD